MPIETAPPRRAIATSRDAVDSQGNSSNPLVKIVPFASPAI